MKRFLAAASILVATVAQATPNWVMLTESEEGNRFLIDVSRYQASTDGGTLFLGSLFRIAHSDGKFSDSFAFVIAAETCASASGLIQQRTFNEKTSRWETIRQYHWDDKGERFYDYAGAALCYMYKKDKESAPIKNNSKGRFDSGSV